MTCERSNPIGTYNEARTSKRRQDRGHSLAREQVQLRETERHVGEAFCSVCRVGHQIMSLRGLPLRWNHCVCAWRSLSRQIRRCKAFQVGSLGSSECSRAPRFLPTLEELSTRGNRQPDKLPMEGTHVQWLICSARRSISLLLLYGQVLLVYR